MFTVRVSSPSSLHRAALIALIGGLGHAAHSDSAEPAQVVVQDLYHQNPPFPPPANVPTLALVEAPERVLFGLLRAGYRGFLPFDHDKAMLERALLALHQGEYWVERRVLESLMVAGAALDMTRREEQVLGLLVQGLPNKTIAQRLGISAATVKTHVSSLLTKHGAKNRFDLACSRTVVKGRGSAADSAFTKKGKPEGPKYRE